MFTTYFVLYFLSESLVFIFYLYMYFPSECLALPPFTLPPRQTGGDHGRSSELGHLDNNVFYQMENTWNIAKAGTPGQQRFRPNGKFFKMCDISLSLWVSEWSFWHVCDREGVKRFPNQQILILNEIFFLTAIAFEEKFKIMMAKKQSNISPGRLASQQWQSQSQAQAGSRCTETSGWSTNPTTREHHLLLRQELGLCFCLSSHQWNIFSQQIHQAWTQLSLVTCHCHCICQKFTWSNPLQGLH